MNELKEEWKPIEGYEGLYEVSNMGRVKSLVKSWCPKEKILSNSINNPGYIAVCLYKNRVGKYYKVHALVYDQFGSGKRSRTLMVDHINGVKTDNRISNLQLLSNRKNVIKGRICKNNVSKYPGVIWRKDRGRWVAKAQICGKITYLGSFTDEYSAYLVYKKVIDEIELKQCANIPLEVG